MTNYKVFCADCRWGYEHNGFKPMACSRCGSDFIAVKAINVADALDLDDMPFGNSMPSDAATGVYDS